MSLSWPWALLVVALVPALLAVRWWQARRRKRGAVLVSSVALVRSAQPSATRWRRVVPPALLLLALVALGVAAARPHREATISSNATTILLALDVSRSMCTTDVDPNRLEAAQQAATDFIEAQPEGSRLGLVTFAGFATVTVPPTDDTEALVRALESLVTSRGTAIGQGILTSIDAIAELDPSVAPTGADVPDSAAPDDAAAVIVLLTDGSNRNGVDPATAAEQAAARGIRVYTIGFGTETPAPGVCNAGQVEPGGGFGAGPGASAGGGAAATGRSTRAPSKGLPISPAVRTTAPRAPTSSPTRSPTFPSTSPPRRSPSTSRPGSPPWPVCSRHCLRRGDLAQPRRRLAASTLMVVHRSPSCVPEPSGERHPEGAVGRIVVK